MRKVETSVKSILTCDNCWKTEEEGAKCDWYSLEKLDPKGLRLYEKVGKTFYEAKHLVNRKEINFCCKDCIKTRMTKQMEIFIEEITPFQETDRKEIIL